MNAPSRRAYPRVRAKSGHYASFPGGVAPIRELGLDGVTLEDPEPLPFNSLVRLRLHLGADSIDCNGTVRHSDPETGFVVIQFADLSPTARKSLASYLAQMIMLENRRRLNDGLNSVANDHRAARPAAPLRDSSLAESPVTPSAKLGEMLVRSGLISEDQLAAVTAEQYQRSGLLPLTLVRFGVVSEEDLLTCFHREYHVPIIDLSTIDPTAEVLQLVPLALARQHAILPIGLSGSTLTIAIGDPSNVDGLNAVKFRSGCELRIALAPVRSLLEAIDHFYAARARATG